MTEHDSYLVEWSINIDAADNPLDAAAQALGIQRGDEYSIAVVFFVTGSDGVRHKVNLEEVST